MNTKIGSKRRAHRNLAGISVVILTLALLAPAAADSLKDGAGRTVVAGDTSRIVSIGGAVTEILYALGKDKQVVGVDTTSFYPARALTERANVGYMRQLSAEGVLGLRPTLILLVDGAGPKETISVLEAAHVPLVVVPDGHSGDGIVEKVRIISKRPAPASAASA